MTFYLFFPKVLKIVNRVELENWQMFKFRTITAYKLTVVLLSTKCHNFHQQNIGAPGGTPLYGLYRYVWPQRVWFFSRFGHK